MLLDVVSGNSVEADLSAELPVHLALLQNLRPVLLGLGFQKGHGRVLRVVLRLTAGQVGLKPAFLTLPWQQCRCDFQSLR